jgi:hypothetical protein
VAIWANRKSGATGIVSMKLGRGEMTKGSGKSWDSGHILQATLAVGVPCH